MMKVAEVVQKYWDERAAKMYDKICYIDEEKMNNVLLNHLNVDKHGVILDFGTGTGFLALMLAKSGYKKIIGLDINESMLNIAKEKLFGYPVKLVRGDGLHLPIADNSVDAVVGRWILWVMPDPERAIEEIVRVTKPGGQVLIFESASISDKKDKSIWKRLSGFPLRQFHYIYITLRFRVSPFRTKWFWRETEGKLPMYSPEKYVQIFKQKGLRSVENTVEEEYGTLCAKLFFGGFKFSIIKGVKPAKQISKLAFQSEEWGMDELLKILVCPICRSNLKVMNEKELICKYCDKAYPIIKGVPNLLPPENKLL
jgi:ubiquinone/menaquinone biosynthesis C-methylase UbiE/uncharacterized protein YbaR (Trm112 family)